MVSMEYLWWLHFHLAQLLQNGEDWAGPWILCASKVSARWGHLAADCGMLEHMRSKSTARVLA